MEKENVTEQAIASSKDYSGYSDSEEDEEDRQLALETEAAINRVLATDYNKPSIIPIATPRRSEWLKECERDIEELKRTTCGIRLDNQFEYKLPEIKLADEIFLQELNEQAKENNDKENNVLINANEDIETMKKSINEQGKDESVKKDEEKILTIVDIKSKEVKKVKVKMTKWQSEVEKKNMEIKLLKEQMNMMEEDEYSRKLSIKVTKEKFGIYGEPLARSAILEFVKCLSFSEAISLSTAQKLGSNDPDEGFVKYSLQKPATISLKMIQEAFIANEEAERPKPKVKECNEAIEFFKQLKDIKLKAPPLINIENNKLSVKITEVIISPKEVKEHCRCRAEEILKQMVSLHKVKPLPIPKYEYFLKEIFYRVNSYQKSINKVKDVKNDDPESEEQQLAELSALCELDSPLNSLPKSVELIELKNLPQADLKELSKFVQTKKLILSMNQLTSLDPIKDLTQLRELYISQNKLAKLDPKAFQRLGQLRILHADLNLLEKIEGLDKCKKLEVLKLDSNRIKRIEGLSKCISLRTLNLYRNQIIEVSGLEELVNLQSLDLGRNKITNVDYLVDSSIIPIISELLLYYNNIESFPSNFSKLLLKSLWISGNKLKTLSIAYCPLLETLIVSENSLVSIATLTYAPCLTTLDISFNNLDTVEALFTPIKDCKTLKSFKFIDNPVIKGRETCFDTFLLRLLPNLSEINAKTVEHKGISPIPKCTNMQRLTEYPKVALSEQAFIDRLAFSERFKLRDPKMLFLKENSHTQYLTKYLPIVHYNNFLKLYKSFIPEMIFLSGSVGLYKNSFLSAKRERKAARTILSFFLRKRMEMNVRMRKYKKYEKEIIKIQARVRGMQMRILYRHLFGKLAAKRAQETKEELEKRMATRIQARVRGFILRRRIKRGLANLGKIDLQDLPNVDIDEFLGPQLEEDDNIFAIPNPEELMKIIERIKVPVKANSSSTLPAIVTNKEVEERKSISKGPRLTDEQLPELSQKNLSKIPGSKNMREGSDISEYTVRTESKISVVSKPGYEIGGKYVMEQIRASHHAQPSVNALIREKGHKMAEEYGMDDEDSKKVIKAWYTKQLKRKLKKHNPTSEERFQKFLASRPPAPTNKKTK